MSWIRACTLAVPSVQLANGAALFAVQLTNARGVRFLTHRSFSQFRALRKTLTKSVAASGAHHHRRRRSPSACSCGEDESTCAFGAALHDVLRAAAFPSRFDLRDALRPTQRDRARLNRRREALQQFLASVHACLAAFDADTLRCQLADANCRVLTAYAAFLNADEHFPAQPATPEALHRPLQLQGWRQLCADQMMRQDESLVEEDEDGNSIVRLAPPTATHKPVEQSQPTTPLPALQVKPLKVQTMHSFMEEFRDGVLAQYADDIAELRDAELSATRKWEICLYVACRIGHTYAVQLILFNYADANTRMADGSSCLHIAARMGREDVVALLLEEGARVDTANDAGVTPLIAACRNGSIKVVQALLDAGADLAACSSRGTYPLHAAIVSQNLELVEQLVARGANVNVMTASGITPLHFAAKLGSLAISEFLLRHHADPGKRTKNDSDAMMIAEANGHAGICELFQRFSGVHGSVDGRSLASSFLTKSSPDNLSPEMVRLCSQRLTAARPSALSVC